MRRKVSQREGLAGIVDLMRGLVGYAAKWGKQRALFALLLALSAQLSEGSTARG